METNESVAGDVEVMDGPDGGESQADPGAEASDPYEAAAENPAIKAAFERVFGGKAGEDIDEEAQAEEDGEEESTPEAEAQGSEEDDADPKQPAGKPAPKIAAKPQAKPAEQEATATLPAALKQAALRAKWEESAIDEFYEANPELATRTFENLQASHNELSRRFAQIGIQRMQSQQPAPAPAPAPAPTPSTGLAGLEAAYKNLPEFAQNNGEQMAAVVKDLYESVVQPFKQMQAAYQQQQQQHMAFQVHQTFDAFKDFADVYGATTKGMTQEQSQSRFQVATLADRIRAGASLQGVDMPVQEAIDMAHNLFTADRKQAMARQQVQQQVVNRAKRITSRPTQRRVPATAQEGGKRSEASAAAAISSWWAERGVDVG